MTNTTMIIPTENEMLQANNVDGREHANNNNSNDAHNSMIGRTNNYYHNSNSGRVSKQHQSPYPQHNSIVSHVNPPANLPFVGLVFVQDTLPNKKQTNRREEILIGTVLFVDTRPSNAHQLRQLVDSQSVFNMDNRYIFLTNIGSPISLGQEVSVELKHLINKHNTVKFTKDYTSIRCSVIGQYLNGHDQLIGYVLASYDLNLKILRARVNEVIRESSTVSLNYTFVHSFHYSINPHNENDILLIDIIRNNAIFIQFQTPFENLITQNDKSRLTKYFSDENLATINEDRPDSGAHKTKNAILKRPTLNLRKQTKAYKPSIRISQRCDVMISYARQEAAEKALQLKDKLIKKGYAVYLDVHEIQMGSDWQDSLNDAVRNCSYFVPLITPMYGKTQWTNREVKLADVLRKPIIPINFLDFWPPECLAIQFATTQYIPWRPLDSPEIKTWDQQSLDLVSKGIISRIKSLNQEKRKDKEKELPLDEATESYQAVLPDKHTPQADNRPLIVISAHPQQSDISLKIKRMLTREYSVWCSNDFMDYGRKEEIGKKNVRNEVNQLPPISEQVSDYPPLTPEVQDFARRIAESSKQRPKSVPNHEISTYEVKKNELSRTATYNGVETNSSISDDKKDELLYFQQKLDASSLVIIVASEQYYRSRTSLKHVYYCGQRKKNILVQGDKSESPVWFTRLISPEFPLNFKSCTFENDLIQKIHTVLDPACKVMNTVEMKMKLLIDNLRKNILDAETCVYVMGSTDLTGQARNIDICDEIAKELAKVTNLKVVTNGYFGVADLIGLRFQKEIEKDGKDSTKSIIHILPLKDSVSHVSKARQNHEHFFDRISYGQTLLMGDSIKERDQAVASLLDTCILVGGDEDLVTVIDEFIWNDRFVVPVPSTGGAAGGEFEVNQKIFTCPNSANPEDWEILKNPLATPNEVAKAVVRILLDLKNAQYNHQLGKNESTTKKSFNEKPQKTRLARSRNRLNINLAQKHRILSQKQQESQWMEPNSPEKVLPCFSKSGDGDGAKDSKGKLRNFFRGINLFSKS